MHTSTITADYTLVAETPQLYCRSSVSEFIEQEVKRPSKQWISSIIAGNQESDQVILRTDEYVLLPDTERVNRYWRIRDNASAAQLKCQKTHPSGKHSPPSVHTSCKTSAPKMTLNWLSILHDMRIRTLRDLRGKHVHMLRLMLEECMAAIELNTGIPKDQIMAYVHYPPSVYQLHVHFSYPYGQYCHRDAYRVHPLPAVINNLEIDSDYYVKATLHLAMYRQSQHYLALSEPATESEDEKKTSLI
jgi:hypothetical protein